jgi:hypothetical protein
VYHSFSSALIRPHPIKLNAASLSQLSNIEISLGDVLTLLERPVAVL